MRARVLVCGHGHAAPLPVLLERAGCSVHRMAGCPWRYPLDCDAVVLAPRDEELGATAPAIIALAANARQAGRLLVLLAPGSAGEELLGLAGLAYAGFRPEEVAGFLLTRLRPAPGAAAPLSLADALVFATATDLRACVASVLESARRLFPQGRPELLLEAAGVRGWRLPSGPPVGPAGRDLLESVPPEAPPEEGGLGFHQQLRVGRLRLGALAVRDADPSAEQRADLERLATVCAAPLAAHLLAESEANPTLLDAVRRQAPHASTDEGRSALRAPGERTRPLVLIVEDDPCDREALSAQLGDGYDLLDAGDGEQGARLARERRPDLVLLDLVMPHLDGFGTIEVLRRDPRTCELPIIVVSANGSESMRVRALRLGAADFLSKPCSGPELVARVERTLLLARQRDSLRTLAQTDGLTGLPNFRAFRGRMDEELERRRRYRTPLTCVMLDLDGFKDLNDRLGHTAGNRALGIVAGLLRQQLRETDFAARYGGDEFVVLLPHTPLRHGAAFAERLREGISGWTVEEGPLRLALRASFGVAATEGGEPEQAEDPQPRADAALYVAKRAGGNRVALAPAPVAIAASSRA